MKKLQMFMWIIIVLAVLVLIGGCVYSFVKAKTDVVVHPEATFEIKDYGNVKIELYPEYAPNTVANFIKLVESGYYNDKVIYGKDETCLYVGRNSAGEAVEPTIGLISEDIEADSEEDYKYSIKGEFISNGFKQNTLRHEKGVISLIRSSFGNGLTEESYNSGSAQMGVMMGDKASNLNGVYAGFAKVTEGLDILEKIYNEAEIAVSENEEENSAEEIEKFANYPVITSASVDKHGIEYGMPEVQEAFDYNSYMLNMLQSRSGN